MTMIMTKTQPVMKHFWYKTDVATRLSKQLVKTYSKLEPSKRTYFKKNADKYLATLDDETKCNNQVKQDLQERMLASRAGL